MKKISVYLIITFCFVQNVVFAQAYGIENGHEWVDLGLPSGTKWATCNVGATKPEGYGRYFAWGEVTPKKVYLWHNYKHIQRSDIIGIPFEIAKYKGFARRGEVVDSKQVLDLQDDAAHINWGGRWRMPYVDELTELRDECYWAWTDSYNGSGYKGYIVYKAKLPSDKGIKAIKGVLSYSDYSLSDAHIFLPAFGYLGDIFDTSFSSYAGFYWAIQKIWSSDHDAWCLHFNPYKVSEYNEHGGIYHFCRCKGLQIRAVIPGNK